MGGNSWAGGKELNNGDQLNERLEHNILVLALPTDPY